MEWYLQVKNLHFTTAVLTVSLLALRLGLDAIKQPEWRSTFLKGLPHINDTLLLGSAIYLLVVTGWNPLQHHWLGMKLLLVMGYIVTGWFALKVTLRNRFRVLAAILSLLQICVVFFLALVKPM